MFTLSFSRMNNEAKKRKKNTNKRFTFHLSQLCHSRRLGSEALLNQAPTSSLFFKTCAHLLATFPKSTPNSLLKSRPKSDQNLSETFRTLSHENRPDPSPPRADRLRKECFFWKRRWVRLGVKKREFRGMGCGWRVGNVLKVVYSNIETWVCIEILEVRRRTRKRARLRLRLENENRSVKDVIFAWGFRGSSHRFLHLHLQFSPQPDKHLISDKNLKFSYFGDCRSLYSDPDLGTQKSKHPRSWRKITHRKIKTIVILI